MNKPLYSLTVQKPVLEALPFSKGFGERNRGAASEIFDEGNPAVKPERITIDCLIASEIGPARDTAFGEDYAAIRGQAAMYMKYVAVATKKGWFGRMRSEVIASRAMKVDPLDFGRLRASPEQFVDYAVSEAERIAKIHDITVELKLQCPEHYARKYLPNRR